MSEKIRKPRKRTPPANPVPVPTPEVPAPVPAPKAADDAGGAAEAIGLPTGTIKTRAPWGTFSIGWNAITRWWPLIEAAAKETGVPAARIAAHIAIESQGNPAAIQKNEG